MFNFIFKIERWKYNKTYQVWVSTEGRFRNKSKVDLPIKMGNRGYCYVKVDCASCQYMLAHRLVMLTWRPTPDAENLTVDHLDHNKRNNALSNLEWVTREENQERATNDLIEVISKKAFEALVNAEVNKRLSLVEPTDDITIYITEEKTPILMRKYIDDIWDTLHINIKIKGGNNKTQFYNYLLNKIKTNKQNRLNYFRLGVRKIYFD